MSLSVSVSRLEAWLTGYCPPNEAGVPSEDEFMEIVSMALREARRSEQNAAGQCAARESAEAGMQSRPIQGQSKDSEPAPAAPAGTPRCDARAAQIQGLSAAIRVNLWRQEAEDIERELAAANEALAVAGSTINDLRVDLDGFQRELAEARAQREDRAPSTDEAAELLAWMDEVSVDENWCEVPCGSPEAPTCICESRMNRVKEIIARSATSTQDKP